MDRIGRSALGNEPKAAGTGPRPSMFARPLIRLHAPNAGLDAVRTPRRLRGVRGDAGRGFRRGVPLALVLMLGCAEGLDPEPLPPTPQLGEASGGPGDDPDQPAQDTDGPVDMMDTGVSPDDSTGDEPDDGTGGWPAGECGDGVVDATEECDLGPANLPEGACTPSCRFAACGDGLVEAGVEECDDGNVIDTDACTQSCTLATCGDGIVHQGVELCDDGNASNSDGCTTECTLASCGDGVVQPPETCDDANGSNTDDCLNTCLDASCGDGFIHAGAEACDDGNGTDTDACPGTCQPAQCGDGFVHAGVEPCDDGNASNEDACLSTCEPASCGDGFVHAGVEQCDGGGDPNAFSCSAQCEDQLVWYQWHFNSGFSPNPMACSDFNLWRSALADDHTSIFLAGTADPTGRTCTGPGATALCNALRTGGTALVNCNGHTWRVGNNCANAIEVTVDGTNCDCAFPGYALRPCVNLVDWGGVGTNTCSGPTQDIYIECGFD